MQRDPNLSYVVWNETGKTQVSWVSRKVSDPLPHLKLQKLNTELYENGKEETLGDCGIERLKRKASDGGVVVVEGAEKIK